MPRRGRWITGARLGWMMAGQDASVHTLLIDFDGGRFAHRRWPRRWTPRGGCGLAAISANDPFMRHVPWLDGPAVLAAAAERLGPVTLVTTPGLSALRGPVPLAIAPCARHPLRGWVVAGVGPASSEADYQASGETRRGFAGRSASARRQSARSCCPAMLAQAVGGSISARRATSGARLS